jgi:hypothetical protein
MTLENFSLFDWNEWSIDLIYVLAVFIQDVHNRSFYDKIKLAFLFRRAIF